MVAVYASTTRAWFDALSSLKPDKVAFWQPTPAQPSRIGFGERWYFKELGQPQLLGYGEYAGWERMASADLFMKYGAATGYGSEADLTEAFRVFNDDFKSTNQIGNVILENFASFTKPIPLSAVGLADLSVRFRYIEGEDPIARYVGGIRPHQPVSTFSLRDPEAARRAAATRKVRIGQSAFRHLLMKTYGPVCAISGPQVPEVLQAAHIQPYVDAESNHVRNGLLLRADMHVLFDLGLIGFAPDWTVLISGKLKGRAPSVEALQGIKANLSSAGGVTPSGEAIEAHRQDVFLP